MDINGIREFADEWLDLEKPLISLLRILFLKCLKNNRKPVVVLSEQLVARLIQVSRSDFTKPKHVSQVGHY